MLYQTLRPGSFDEVVGNEGVISSLKSLVELDHASRPHAYLFVGDSGCGKTTLARIFAREIRCNGMDLFELNAANTRGIDTIREVVNGAMFAPMGSESKAYIFDECHQLTPAAQEALLKVIEDTPLRTYFLFCTTAPENLIKPLRNRCATYQVSRLRPPEMKVLLEVVVEALGVQVSEEVIAAIVRHADGCAREALVDLEKILGVDPEKAEEVLASISESEKDVIDLCRELVSKREDRWRKCLLTLERCKSTDSESVRKQILGYLKQCVMGAARDNNLVAAARYGCMMRAFDKSTYYSGMPALVAMILEACIEVE
jgi:DNA polymerase-3 subunit gamma/tau